MKHAETPTIVRTSLETGPPTYSTAGAADVLQCSAEHIRRLVDGGELKASQRLHGAKGSTLVIPRESLIAYLERGLR
jgi:excisionase family DNA binding protein